jgi:hypothetical protein
MIGCCVSGGIEKLTEVRAGLIFELHVSLFDHVYVRTVPQSAARESIPFLT